MKILKAWICILSVKCQTEEILEAPPNPSTTVFPDTKAQNETVEIHLNETSVGQIPFLPSVTESQSSTSTVSSFITDLITNNATSLEAETMDISVTMAPTTKVIEENSTDFPDTTVLDKILNASGTNLTDLLDLNLTEVISGLSINETLETTTFEPTTTTTTTTTTTIYRNCEDHPEEEHPCNFQKRGGGAVVADCSIKQLKQIPCDVGNVTRLVLGNNYIKNIYLGEFDNLENLKEIELDNNGVEFIGKMAFRNMQKLEKLSIKQSHIATIRNDFHYGLESLSHITYNFGGIQNIESGAFNGLNNLKELYMKENEIRSLPANLFASTPNLIGIDIQMNQISSFENSTFLNLKTMTHLLLGDNLIEEIPEYSFRDLGSLQELYLQNNRLKNITRLNLIGLESIKKIYLQGNNIQSISLDAFEGMNNLEVLDLSANNFTILHGEWFLPKLRIFKISGNHWDCGCDASSFKYKLEDASFRKRFEMITDDPMLNCTIPEQMKGQIFNNMEIEKFPPEGKECKAPSSVWGNSPIRVNRKSNLELKCEITDGFPIPLYNWTTPSKGSFITNGNILQVNNTKDNDAGQYGCRAINIAGVATQFFSVTISYECGKYDELGNIIALDEDCSEESGSTGDDSYGQANTSATAVRINMFLFIYMLISILL